MRRFIGRWLAVLAVVAGVSVGASALPAAAAIPASASTHSHAHPSDWWL